MIILFQNCSVDDTESGVVKEFCFAEGIEIFSGNIILFVVQSLFTFRSFNFGERTGNGGSPENVKKFRFLS